MTKQLVKIQRFRLSAQMDEDLNNLHKFGINKSNFVRQAIKEKLNNLPVKHEKQYCPL